MQRLRTGSRASLVVAVVLFLLVSGTTGAVAHRVYNGWLTMWDQGGKCVDGKTSVDHGTYGKGWFQGEVRTEKPSLGLIDCYDSWGRPSGTLRVRVVILKGANLNVCLSPAFYTNAVTTNYLAQTYALGGSAPPCGSGEYASRIRGGTKINGIWTSDNGGIWSEGFHTLPTTPG